jgi:hypothetical protein
VGFSFELAMKKVLQILSFIALTLVLTACGGGGGSGSPSTSSSILGLALSSDNATLYIANADRHIIQSLNLSTLAVSTLAGGLGLAGTATGTGTAARFYAPYDLVRVGSDLYVSDTYNHGIRKVTSSGVVTNLAGTLGSYGVTDNTTGTSATFNTPKGIASDGTTLFVVDSYNNLIRTIAVSSTAVSTLAGSANSAGYVDGAMPGVKFNSPFGAVISGSTLYISDAPNNSIRSVNILNGTTATVAGSTAGTAGSTNATGSAARFSAPAGIVGDGTNLYVADSDNHLIRKIVISSGVVTTLAGSGAAGSADGTGTAAQFNTPIGLALDSVNGILYVSDQVYTKVRKIVLSTGAVTTLNVTF